MFLGAALDLEPAWLAGYAWRYVGDGAGLALAFLALGLRGVRTGVAYGLVVCCGLLMTLVVSPDGATLLFELDTTTVVMAVIGHVIFGAILGALAGRRPRFTVHLCRIPPSVWSNPRVAPCGERRPTVARSSLILRRGSHASVGSEDQRGHRISQDQRRDRHRRRVRA